MLGTYRELKSLIFTCLSCAVIVFATRQSASMATEKDSISESTPDAPEKSDGNKKDPDLDQEVKIFDGKTLENWRIVEKFDFDQHGKVEVREGSIHLERGKPATGISIKTKIPKLNYELTCSARRVEGSDFFCGLTFPVKEQFCTLILGGWGGQIVGLSNIDSFNAAENNTTQVIDFKNGQWYKVRLRVTDEFIRVWIDDEQIIEVETDRHEFSIYWEQEPVRPLGLVTWYTHGEIKGLKLHKLKPKPNEQKKGTIKAPEITE